MIDTTSYDKHAKHPPGFGYEARAAAPTSLIVHSTSNPHQKNTSFESEATFLLNASLVAAHYLIGKDGYTVQFLDPLWWAAWHAGNCRPAFVNQKSIGVELHHSVGDPPYPKEQLDALSDLVRDLMTHFAIPITLVETHGQVAIRGPYIRKHDPSDWAYASFVLWRSKLPTVSLPSKRYKVLGVPVYQQQQCTGPVALYLNAGAIVEVDKVYPEKTGHLRSEAGFIRLDQSVEAV